MKDEIPEVAPDLTTFFLSHIEQIGIGILAILITMVLSEIIKPLVVYGLMRMKNPAPFENSILRAMVFFIGLIPVFALDFRRQWQIMTGVELDLFSAFLGGACLTWAGAQLVWFVAHDVKPVLAFRAWLYRRLGVEDLLKTENKND
jgi:hypothetical protein